MWVLAAILIVALMIPVVAILVDSPLGKSVARRMEGLTGADIESVCKKAALLAIGDFQAGRRGMHFVVNGDDFNSCIQN